MSKPKPFVRRLTESGPLIAASVAAAMTIGIVAPASAQFFPFGFEPPRPRQNVPQGRAPFGDFFAPFQGDPSFQRQPPQQQQPQYAPRVDYSRAPSPRLEKGETAPERHILVLGDAMADWLAYGLEDALSEQPDMGVTRKHRTVSGLIRYQPRGEPSDWVGAAKGIVGSEKADAIVVMLGLHDRTSLTESAAERAAAAKKDDRKKPDSKGDDTSKTDDEASPDDQASGDNPESIAAPERGARSAGSLEFRSERWIEIYKKKIEDMIAVARTKNVPVLWVGLPALRGQKPTSDALFLNSLYREVAAKTGITYVDIWDGFVDEAGRFLVQGPDFEGQTRRLRTNDGVYFTRAGARKLAHYVDRELQRLMLNRAIPVALPADPGVTEQDVTPKIPGGPAPRPLAGPVVPLVAASVNSSELMGGAGSRPAAVDTLAARTLVKGEALNGPGGRADDASWPRRALASINAPNEPMPVSSNPNATPESISAAAASVLSAPMPPAPPPAKRRPRPKPPADATTGGQPDLFGSPSRRPPAYTQQPQRPASPRPPAPVGRSAYAPGGFFSR